MNDSVCQAPLYLSQHQLSPARELSMIVYSSAGFSMCSSPCACALAEPAHKKGVWNKMDSIFIIAEYSTGNKPVFILERYFSKMTLWKDLI